MIPIVHLFSFVGFSISAPLPATLEFELGVVQML